VAKDENETFPYWDEMSAEELAAYEKETRDVNKLLYALRNMTKHHFGALESILDGTSMPHDLVFNLHTGKRTAYGISDTVTIHSDRIICKGPENKSSTDPPKYRFASLMLPDALSKIAWGRDDDFSSEIRGFYKRLMNNKNFSEVHKEQIFKALFLYFG